MHGPSPTWQPPHVVSQPLTEESALMERVLYEVKKVVVGQDVFLERILVALLAQAIQLPLVCMVQVVAYHVTRTLCLELACQT